MKHYNSLKICFLLLLFLALCNIKNVNSRGHGRAGRGRSRSSRSYLSSSTSYSRSRGGWYWMLRNLFGPSETSSSNITSSSDITSSSTSSSVYQESNDPIVPEGKQYDDYGGDYPWLKIGSEIFDDELPAVVLYEKGSFPEVRQPYIIYTIDQPPINRTDVIELEKDMLIPCDRKGSKICPTGTKPVCLPKKGRTVLCVKAYNEKDQQCLSKLNIDTNLLDEGHPTINQWYDFCIVQIAETGPEYEVCMGYGSGGSNDYKSVLNKDYIWTTTLKGFMKTFAVYNYDNPPQASEPIILRNTDLTKCISDVDKFCPPNTVARCGSLNEIMCLSDPPTLHCSKANGTCILVTLRCNDKSTDLFCKDRSEWQFKVNVEIPCFNTVTITSDTKNNEFAHGLSSSPFLNDGLWSYEYCLVTLGLPKPDQCVMLDKKINLQTDALMHSMFRNKRYPKKFTRAV